MWTKNCEQTLRSCAEAMHSLNENWNVTSEVHLCVLPSFAGRPETPVTLVSAETIRGVSSPDLIQSSLWILTLLCPLQKLLKLYKAVTIHTAQAKHFSNIWYVPCQISLECSCSSASSSHNSTEWKMIPNGLCWAWIFKIYIYSHRETLGICFLTAVQHDSDHKITILE